MAARPSDKNKLWQEREKLHAMLLSSVSHDLKTPLSCIIGSLEIYQQLKGTLSSEHKDTLINTAIEEARRLDSFVSNILDMSKLESGGRFKYEYVDIGELVRQCVLQMEPRLRQHDVQLALSSRLMVEVNASWINRAVALLLDNAARYTPQGSMIRVMASGDGKSFHIAVRDHGPGIPRKIQTKLFLKHARAARQDAKIGTGLGLPICKAVADAHGGSIALDTPADGGACFTLTLPLAQKQKRPA